ncbi:MAG: restriction endonuclease subunit S [Actinobacteria bacterium]|nr:restriction endonuclease subunit S [Actinomycetota bacterium]
MSLALDKSSWKRVTFGDVVRNVNQTVKDADAAGIDRVIAMEHMDPGELKIERWGSAADGTTFTRRVQPGQTLFGKRRAYQRKVAFAEFDAICSGDVYTFEADESHLMGEFLPFLVQSDRFFDHALDTSAGSLSPRTNWRDLANFEFDLPPLDEQKRIADLLWAIERHKLALSGTISASRTSLAHATAARLASLTTRSKLGDIATTRSGPSFAASDVHETSIPGSVPVLGIPNTKPDGTIDLDGLGYVSGLPDSVGRIDDSSLILIRTNGNRQRIGNVYIPPEEAHGYAVSAFQFLMQVKNPADRKFLFRVLNEDGMQARMSEGASGTVGLGNLAVRWLNEQLIPWSADPNERQTIVDHLDKLEGVLDVLRSEMDATSVVRKSVLTEIFGGN